MLSINNQTKSATMQSSKNHKSKENKHIEMEQPKGLLVLQT